MQLPKPESSDSCQSAGPLRAGSVLIESKGDFQGKPVVIQDSGLLQALKAFDNPALLAAGIGVGICSSVIPYVYDRLAMSRLRRSSFALLLALLPASAAIIGALVLAQLPSI